jgi:uncharacterized membrane protein
LAVLTEIAERALSPAVNDPGTAIDILSRAVRLFAKLADHGEADLDYPRIWVPPLSLADMMDDIFPPISRDGAKNFAVQIRLQKALLALTQIAPARFGVLATYHSEIALERCRGSMMPHEVKVLEEASAEIATTAKVQRARPI